MNKIKLSTEDKINIPLYLEWLPKTRNDYKNALKKIQKVEIELKEEIVKTKKFIKSKLATMIDVKMFGGYSWYTDDRDIFRFFINTKNIRLNKENVGEFLQKFLNDRKSIKKIKEKISLEIESKQNSMRLFKKLNDKIVQDSSIEEINIYEIVSLDEQVIHKVFSDFTGWEIDRFYGKELPDLIRKYLDKIFRNEEIVFLKYKTFEKEKLDIEKGNLYSKIYKEVNDFILNELEETSGDQGPIILKKIENIIKVIIKDHLSDLDNIGSITKFIKENLETEEIIQSYSEENILTSKEDELSISNQGESLSIQNMNKKNQTDIELNIRDDGKMILEELVNKKKNDIAVRGNRTYIATVLEDVYQKKYRLKGYTRKKFIYDIYNYLNENLKFTSKGWSQEKMLDTVQHLSYKK